MHSGKSAICVLAIALAGVLSAAPVAAAESSPAEAVKQRAEALYGRLIGKNARHLRVRDDLAPFFVNEEELSAFLVRLARDFDEKGIYTNRIDDRRIEVSEVDAAYGFAETKADLAGDWILWFNRSVERTDRWKFIDGSWFVNPPPLKDLEFR